MRTVINIKTEKSVKVRAQKIAKEMGLSLSAVINAYLKQFVRNKEVHFSIAPKMSTELENMLGKIEFDILALFLLKKNLRNIFLLYEDSLSQEF